MLRQLRPGRVISSLLALAAAVGLSMVSITPASAATNATLGDLNAANPAANKYAGCVASVLVGSGVTFGSLAALGTDLAAIWPTLPTGVAAACKQAVDTKQPQVCVNPTSPATCPAIGAATAAVAANLAVGFPGTWKIASDGVGIGGYGQTPLPTSGAPAPVATVSGVFTTPTSVCTTRDCTVPPAPGLWTDCGPTTCGPVTSLTVSVIGRTPNGENGVKGNLRVVDGFGNVADLPGIFGNPYWGYGCGTGDCTFSARVGWNCKDSLGASANCGGQTLAVSFRFDSGAGGDCGCAGAAPAVGQVVEIQLSANNLNASENPTVCAGQLDCMRYDDARLSYLDGTARPTVVLNSVAAPSAVIDLASSGLACLVGVDVTRSAAISCLDVNAAFAPLLQTAHALVGPPTITAGASPVATWSRTPVTISLSASADVTRSIQSITYSATGAQPMPATVVPAATAQVVVSADGATSLSYSATDNAGITSAPQSLTVQVDRSAPSVTCAAPSTAWSSTDVTVACSAGDELSGLADPTQAQLTLTTSVPPGTETAAAATGSVSVCDTAGNCATAGPITGLKVDRLGPTITIASPTGSYTVGDAAKASYTCIDDGSGTSICTGSQADGTAIDTSTAGTYSFMVDATDAVGNHSQRVASYLVAAPPAITASASPSGGWQRTPVTVSLAASADKTRGVQSITYSASGAQAAPETVVPGAAAQVVIAADGTTTLFFWATDTAGALSAAQGITVQVDSTAPAVACATPGTAWSSTDVTVACTATDGHSGLADRVQAQLSLTTSVPDGTETSTAATGSVTVCDLAGNCATAGPITGLKVDRAGPAVTITAPAGAYPAGQVVDATYSCTDGGSGVATCTGTQPSGSAFDTAVAGIYSFTVDATDAAGNHTQRVAAYLVTAPPPPPTVTATAIPSNGWQHTPVTISLTASDGVGPGVQSITYTTAGGVSKPEVVVAGSTAQVVVSADGVTTLIYWATDMAGSSSSAKSITVQLDSIAPVITCAKPAAGWSLINVTVSCTASDTLSGLADPAQAELTLSTSVPVGTETAAAATGSVAACDVAGNCPLAGPLTGLQVDRLGPSIKIGAPAGTYTAGQVVYAAYACTDGGSGVAACSGSQSNGTAIGTAHAGTYSFTVDATDAVGNHSQRVASYTVTTATPTPAPAPSPACKNDENASAHGDLSADKSDVKKCATQGAAVRPVATPKALPSPAPTHRPSTYGGEPGDKQDH